MARVTATNNANVATLNFVSKEVFVVLRQNSKNLKYYSELMTTCLFSFTSNIFYEHLDQVDKCELHICTRMQGRSRRETRYSTCLYSIQSPNHLNCEQISDCCVFSTNFHICFNIYKMICPCVEVLMFGIVNKNRS